MDLFLIWCLITSMVLGGMFCYVGVKVCMVSNELLDQINRLDGLVVELQENIKYMDSCLPQK